MELKLKKLLPFLDDEELNLLADKIAESETGEYEGVKAPQLLPYLSEEKAGELMIAAIKQGRDARVFGPYASEQAYRDMAELYGQYDFDIASFFCYMDDEALDRLAERAAKGEISLPESKILPFLDEKKTDELFLSRVREGKDYRALLPFVSDACWNRLADEYEAGACDIELVDEVYMFMDDAAVKKIFKAYLNKRRGGENN